MPRFQIVVALALLSAACAGHSAATGPSCLGTERVPEPLGRASRVFVITVDGLAPRLIDGERTPHLARLWREGARSIGARTVALSLTLPAHVSMITGLPPERHGVLWNAYRAELGPVEIETVFDVAHGAGLTTALVAGKEKLKHLIRPAVLDHGVASDRNDRAVMDEALWVIERQRPNLMLIHLPEVDHAGHMWGWNSEAQRRTAGRADEEVGRLLDALERLEIADDSALLITSDHGGAGRRHSDGDEEDFLVPWIVWGGGVEPRDLPPVCVTDTAPAVLRLLGLPVPDGWSSPGILPPAEPAPEAGG